MGTLRTVAAVAAVNFLVQGVVWCVLSLLAILAYTCHFTPSEDKLDASFTALAKVYFTDPSCWSGGETVKKLGVTSASQMVTISSLQFVFNFLLSIISLVLMFVIPRGSSHAFLLWTYNLLFVWLGTAVLDLVTTATFSSDKDAISSGTSSVEVSEPLGQMLLVVSLVAVRGYLYWALNFLLMMYLLIASTMRLFKACKKLDESKQSNGTINSAFELDEEGVPSYAARSRWPWLGVPLWRRQQLASGGVGQGSREEHEQRERFGFGSRVPLETRHHISQQASDHLSNIPPQTGKQNGWTTGADTRHSPTDGSTSPRPQSLHEAILTLKPLRQVRPKLPPDMQQGRY